MDLGRSQEVHLSHYWNIVQKRWKVAVAILAVVMAGTFLASFLSKPLYRSSIMIQIERENPNQVTVEDLFGIEVSDQEFMQTQYVLLKSRGLAQRVIDEHKLLNDPDFYPAGVSGKTPEELRKIREDMANALLSGIEVNPVRSTSLVEVAYIASTPRLAQKVSEAIGDSFIRMNIEKKIDAVTKASEFLTRQIAVVKNEIDQARSEMQRYGESKDIVSTADASNITVQRLMTINTDLSAAQNDRIVKQAAYESLLRTGPEAVTNGDPVIQAITGDEARLQREYAQKLSTYLPDHPEMKRLKAQLDKARQTREALVAEAYQKAKESARGALQAAQSREHSLRAALEQQKRETLKLNANAVTYTDLRAGIESKQQLLDQLTKRLNETEVTSRLRGSNTSNVHWVDHAQLPAGRFNATMKKNLQSAFPLGVILGLSAIFFLEYMDRSIKSPEELERVTHFASLGIIPSASSVGKGGYQYGYSSPRLRAVGEEPPDAVPSIELVPYRDSRSPIAEAYRAFRTSLLLASANSPKVIVITSTFAKEGKTTTSVNLATVLAQMGKPVLLIDADLRRPRLQKVFPNKPAPGLVNYLAANVPIDDVIQETEVPNLSVILSGPTPPNPSELLSSDRMKHLIEEMRGRYAFVIFDSPPVMAVTDAIVLASNADGVVLCVHGGQTAREIVQRAAERLRQSNIPVLGALLNNLDLHQYGYTFKKSYYDYYDSEPAVNDGAPARKSV
jgi:capsular exopolysaccharide synthesis family protein